MKRILLLATLILLLTPSVISADEERVDELEEQIERMEEIIERLSIEIDELITENEELETENNEMRLLLQGQIGFDFEEEVQEGITEVTDVTEIQFNTDIGNYKIEEIFILPEGQPESIFQNQPALLVLYEVEVKEEGFQSNNLFIYDMYTYQEFDVSYKDLQTDTIQFYMTDYPQYFEHNFEIIKQGATIKNASLFILEDTESPVIFEKDGIKYKVDLNDIEVKERSN